MEPKIFASCVLLFMRSKFKYHYANFIPIYLSIYIYETLIISEYYMQSLSARSSHGKNIAAYINLFSQICILFS